jgi:hypothetical protein
MWLTEQQQLAGDGAHPQVESFVILDDEHADSFAKAGWGFDLGAAFVQTAMRHPATAAVAAATTTNSTTAATAKTEEGLTAAKADRAIEILLGAGRKSAILDQSSSSSSSSSSDRVGGGGMEAAAAAGAPVAAVAASPSCLPFVEEPAAFSAAEVARALTFFSRYFESTRQSFTPLELRVGGLEEPATAHTELEWLTAKMLRLAAAADKLGGWGLTRRRRRQQQCDDADGGEEDGGVGGLQPTDAMIYDRFGPAYSDVTFSWHCDDTADGPRDISVVAYFSEPGACHLRNIVTMIKTLDWLRFTYVSEIRSA